jgi:hypothetical protein
VAVQVLRRGVDIVVATPGPLLDHLQRRTIDLSAIDVLALDEADRMLDMGFLPALRRIVAALPRGRQSLLFSATLSDAIVDLSAEFTRDAVRVDVSPWQVFATTVTHQVHDVAVERKRDVLTRILAHHGTSATTIQSARWRSSAANASNSRSARPFRLTYFTPRFGLTLGPSPIRGAGARLHIPVPTECEIRRVNDHRAGRAIAAEDERAGVVPEHGPWHATEMREGGDALAPTILPLIEKRFDEQPAGVTEDRDEQEDPHPLARDPHALLAEIDLQLIARRTLAADCRKLRGAARTANVGAGALDRPHADRRAALCQQSLHDHRIAAGASLVERPRLTADVVRQSPSRRSAKTLGAAGVRARRTEK